ncbi:PorT family protein [Hymenobacter sp. BT635]|uniref:PorT family protein n=1 Tax=Hymenobacter nitidus TaxID=2880929 RepID=A0ABS8ACK2_9BACT|nr:outer membrane beta-barrel protein [Hymenobacter nitidus]MCB2378133.1 PorT family protein [Hymenobacter nitidus]
MNKKLLSLLVSSLSLYGTTTLLAPASAQAQSGPQKGYVVLPAGDTLRGTVVLGRASRNALTCEFQAADQFAATQYQPTELRGYGTDMLTYESQTVPRIADSVGVATMPVFLETITRGPLTLYALSSDGKERYFLGGYRPGKLVELLQRQKQIQQNGRNYLVKQPLYQDTLARAFQSCPDQAKRVTQYSFQAQQLEKAVRSYNTCAAPELVAKQSAHRGNFGFGVLVGRSVSDMLAMGRNDGSDAQNRSYDGDSYFTVGLSIAFTPGYKGAPFTVHSGVLYERNRSFEEKAVPALMGGENVKLKLSYVVIPAMLRYSIGHGRLRPYAEAGGSARLLAGVSEDEVYFTSSDDKVYPQFTYSLLGGQKTFAFGLGAGAGLELRLPNGQQLSLGLRAEKTSGPSLLYGGSTFTNVNALLGYTFSK